MPKKPPPQSYTASPTVGPYANPKDESPDEVKARQLVTNTDYYKYLRALRDYPELQGWRPDYLNLYQDPAVPIPGRRLYGGKEGFEPTPTTFSSTPAGYSKVVYNWFNAQDPRYYYKNRPMDLAKDGIKGFMTNDPTNSVGAVIRNLEALKYAREHGVNLPPEASDPYYIAARYLKEVRDEGGANPPDSGSYSRPVRQQMERNQRLVEDRFGFDAGNHLSQAVEKGRVSNKLGLDFFKAWNGTGKADKEAGGGGGSNYSYRMRHDFIPAAHHPRNAAFVDFIRRHLDPKTPYETPLTEAQYNALKTMYSDRQRAAFNTAWNKRDNNLLRRLQWELFKDNKYLGVPDEYNPVKMMDAVKPPDYAKLTGYADPLLKYNNGGLAFLNNRRIR